MLTDVLESAAAVAAEAREEAFFEIRVPAALRPALIWPGNEDAVEELRDDDMVNLGAGAAMPCCINRLRPAMRIAGAFPRICGEPRET